jgi:hypothetical protein
VWNALRRLINRANRAGVVLYTIDARGLQTAGSTAEDSVFSGTTRAATRLSDLLHSQEGLLWLAEQTGGLAVVNNNDLKLGLHRVLDDQQGYYLLGYEAQDRREPRTWEPGRVRVRVRRDGLWVRWRHGLFGPADVERHPPTEGDALAAAALSPFTAHDVTVRLTALFGYNHRSGPYVHTLLFVDPEALTLTRAPSGAFEGEVDVLTLAVGDSGQVVGRRQQREKLRLTEAEYRRAHERGLVYTASMRVSGGGGLQVRPVLRDTASGRVGSGSQFIEVPAVGRGRLAVSGVLMKGTGAHETQATEHVTSLTDAALVEGVASVLERGEAGARSASSSGVPESLLAEPTVRVFRPGSTVIYAYEVYSGLRPRDRLTMTTVLLRDGRPVYQSPPGPVAFAMVGDGVQRVPIAGSLRLGSDMPEGAYTLQVTVTADRPGRRDLRTSQWVDFEVLRR